MIGLEICILEWFLERKKFLVEQLADDQGRADHSQNAQLGSGVGVGARSLNASGNVVHVLERLGLGQKVLVDLRLFFQERADLLTCHLVVLVQPVDLDWNASLSLNKLRI